MCFKSRLLPALCVTILSVVVLITGLILVVQSTLFYTAEAFYTQNDLGSITQYVQIFRITTFAILLSLSLLIIATGCVGTGCLCPPFKSFKIFTWIFGC